MRNREARIAAYPTELAVHIDWLDSELAQQTDQLPYADREYLRECLVRWRTQRVLGQSTGKDTRMPELINHMRKVIGESGGVIRIDWDPPYRPELVRLFFFSVLIVTDFFAQNSGFYGGPFTFSFFRSCRWLKPSVKSNRPILWSCVPVGMLCASSLDPT